MEGHDTEFIGIIAGLGAALFSASLTIGVSYLRSFSHNVLVFYGGVGGFLLVLFIHRYVKCLVQDFPTRWQSPNNQREFLFVLIYSNWYNQ